MALTTNYSLVKRKIGHPVRDDDVGDNLDLIDAAIKAREDETDGITVTSNTWAVEKATITLTGATKINLDGPIDITGKLALDGMGGAASASGLLLGIGTAVSPATTATANGKFIEMRCETTASSGDNRLAYLRYAIEGAGGGECLRASTVVNENTGTAHGAHFGIEFKAEAGGSECSGLGVGLRGTLMIPNITSWAPAGTYAGLMGEIYSEGEHSDPAGMTELSALRLINDGNATGMADVDTDAFLMSIQGFTAGTGKVVEIGESMGTVTGTLKIKVEGDTRYLPFYSAPG